MNDINRNTRTLIVSFVVAIMVMIPLRFIEVGQMSQSMVLGETDEVEEVVLPNAQVRPEVKLEAPYDEIEQAKVLGEKTVVEKNCLPPAEASVLSDDLRIQIERGNLTRDQLDEALNQLIAVDKNVCR